MRSPIADFTSRFLARHGALVESDAHGIAALIPPVLAWRLGVSEYERFAFDRRVAPGHALVVDYDSPLLDRFGGLVEELGRAAWVPAPPWPPKAIDPEAALADAVTVTNGIVRECRGEPGSATYVGFMIEYELLADERVSGLLEVWVNPTMRSAPRLEGLTDRLLETAQSAEPTAGVMNGDDSSLPARGTLRDRLEPPDDSDETSSGRAVREGAPADLAGTVAEAWRVGAALARHAVERRLEAAIESLRRRRDRDFLRLQEYHQAIDQEIRGRARRAALKGDERAAGAEASRLDATARAYQARLTDLVDRYRVRVRLRPIAVLACALPVVLVTARLHRRSAGRSLTFAWNPVDRAIEPPCCEACGIAAPTVVLCDERVHLLCTACHGPCESCRRPYCRACHARCPRRHEANELSGRRADGPVQRS